MEKRNPTRKIVLIALIILAMILLWPKSTYATTYSVSAPSSAQPGQTVTITINCSGLYGRFDLSATNATLSQSSISSIGSNVSVTATVGSSGTARVVVTATDVSDVNEESPTNSPQSCSINIITPSTPSTNNDDDNLPTASTGGTATTVQSSNNYLKSLSVSAGSINFDKKTTKYTINVGEDVESITVNGAAEHERATVKGTGSVSLKKGNNTINLAVTAENGSVRTYTLTVVRAGQPETTEGEKQEQTAGEVLGLSSLKLKGVKDNGDIVELLLTPEFSTGIFSYECSIPEGVTFIDVEHGCDILDAIVEVTGNDNLQEGENLINIIIQYKDDNGEEQTVTYQVVAKKEAAETTQEINENKGLNPLQIGIIVGSITIALVIIIVLIVRYVKQQKRELEDEFGGYGEPFYDENEEDIFEEPMGKEEQEEVEEPEELEQEKDQDLDNWDEFEEEKPKKKRKFFGTNAKKGKHF